MVEKCMIYLSGWMGKGDGEEIYDPSATLYVYYIGPDKYPAYMRWADQFYPAAGRKPGTKKTAICFNENFINAEASEIEYLKFREKRG
jgi:hypothetical protein